MLKNIKIENYGRIKSIDFDVTQINVFIGADDVGKYEILNHLTNILNLNTLDNSIYKYENVNKITLEFLEYWVDGFSDKCEDFTKGLDPFIYDKLNDILYVWDWQLEGYYPSRAIKKVIEYLHLVSKDNDDDIIVIDDFGDILNPLLTIRLFVEMYEQAIKNDKQLFIFTNQPVVLDQLFIDDESKHSLFSIERGIHGHTRVFKIKPLKPLHDQDKVVDLSVAWLRGYIGGL